MLPSHVTEGFWLVPFKLPSLLHPEIVLLLGRTLKAFKTLGMNIDFLLEPLEHLMSLAAKLRRHKEARLEKTNAEKEMRILEANLSNLKELTSRLDIEIQQLEPNAENYELMLMFQEVAKAPW
ncbi:hypothetical protein JCGZ_24355 [Jatropha curcas]|uniref:Uncharacterized protein n=1 Tax=Jatropha curcas TaxID=180498 RepID=A0A067L280_JATCU|nr:hypothetical protein JCGZ_24355 [Jatropha curcas]